MLIQGSFAEIQSLIFDKRAASEVVNIIVGKLFFFIDQLQLVKEHSRKENGAAIGIDQASNLLPEEAPSWS